MNKRRQVFAVLMCVILMSACTGKKVEMAIEAPEPVKVVQEKTEVETVKSTVSEQEAPPQEIPQNIEQEVKKTLEINIIIQGQTFNITLEENKTATAFIDMLPMTINMTDVNRNEKYYVLPETIRKEASEKVGTIHKGDLMCYGDAGLVLFYESFSTPYSYVPIGHMSDITGFVKALGTGEASVTLSLKADSTN